MAVLFFLKCLKVLLELRVLIEEIRNMEVFDALSSLRRLRVVEINPFLMFVNDRLYPVNGRSVRLELSFGVPKGFSLFSFNANTML